MSDKASHLKIVKGGAQTVPCPICDKPAIVPYTPFCSRRCTQLDLSKWLTGDYAIPAHEAMDDSNVELFLAEQVAAESNEGGESY